MLWWWWSYVCLNECLWMQMYDIMYRANECLNPHIRSHNQNLGSLRNNKSLLFIFRLHRLFFGVSALTFRCKFCIPLGTSFELLRLIFRRYLALHSLRNDFWAENLRCAPLGTTFCSFVVLCIPLGTIFELLPAFSLFLHSMVHAQILHFTFFWGIWLS